MSRQPRLDIPHVPQHIVQRGNDRRPCFFSQGDYSHYLSDLRESAARYDVSVHAYVLMGNHVHLLATAAERGGISRMVQFLGRRYVSYINRKHQRTGTLWEGRYKSCLVDSDSYLWNCYRYIELNPVRACLVGSPEEYGWSSYHGNALKRVDPLLSPHPQYLALASNEDGRRDAYRGLFCTPLEQESLSEIRAYLQQQRAWGSDAFQASAAAKLGRYAQIRPAHRPLKSVPVVLPHALEK